MRDDALALVTDSAKLRMDVSKNALMSSPHHRGHVLEQDKLWLEFFSPSHHDRNQSVPWVVFEATSRGREPLAWRSANQCREFTTVRQAAHVLERSRLGGVGRQVCRGRTEIRRPIDCHRIDGVLVMINGCNRGVTGPLKTQ